MFKRTLLGAIIGLAIFGMVGKAHAVLITNTYAYQGAQILPGNTITGTISITASSFRNLLVSLADTTSCLAHSCSFQMTNGSGLNTWNNSNIGASRFDILWDVNGNIQDWFMAIGSGPFGLFSQNFVGTSSVGDRVVDNGTLIPGPGSATNGIAGVWTLTSTTAVSVPEPGTLVLFALGLSVIILISRRRRPQAAAV